MRPTTDAGTVPAAASLAMEAALWAARRIAGTPPQQVSVKTHGADLLTALDRAVETQVRALVANRFPTHRFVGEEHGTSGPADADLTWYCDPIDGTTNYANGVPWCSFALCCHDEQGPVVGVVVDPFRRELFSGRRGGGASRFRLDDDFRPAGAAEPLRAHPGNALAGTVVTTEWLANVPWNGMADTCERLAAQGCTVRIMGSSALSIVQAAAGRAAACILGHYDPVDDSAALLIAAEAGAVVCDERGRRTLQPAAGGVLVAGPQLAADVLAAWRPTAPR